MRRYVLFGSSRHYPEGGWNDFVQDFDSESEAVAAGKELVAWHDEWMDLLATSKLYVDVEWWHVADIENRTIVARGWSQQR